ncbi:MAG: S9 family peptidase [Saprospiraceae bacterium]|nr:S9 family peptidase [Saprospiraceae bacterium]
MFKVQSIFFIGILVFSLISCKNSSTLSYAPNLNKNTMPNYPETRKDTVWDDYFGTKIQDPYRWLEDDHAEETKAWVASQNKFSYSYLDKIPFRKDLRARIEKLFDFEKCSTPFKKSGKYYFFKNNGLQNQDVLFTSNQLNDSPTLLLDPNTFSKDGTTSLSNYSFSSNGKYMALQLSVGGSDWNQILVFDLNTRQFLADTIRWVKFSGTAWHGDGFYYSRYPEPKGNLALSEKNEFHTVYYHKIGTNQSDDQIIYQDLKHPLRNVVISITEDERFLVLSVTESTSGNSLAIRDLSKKEAGFEWLVSSFENDYIVLGNVKDKLYIHTNKQSLNWKVVTVNMNSPKQQQWNTIIAEAKDVLDSVCLIGGKLVASYLHNASSLVKIYDLNGTELNTLVLPEVGTLVSINGTQNDTEAFYSFSSFIRPPTIYRIDLIDFKTTPFFKPKLADYDPDLYTTEQVWYPSKDGTKIPMFLTHKKDLVKGNNPPTLLYGYGGFNVSYLPTFMTSRIPILENGGIYAVANLRGGGEFGKEWHMAGTKEKKQTVFDDFIAATDFLVNENYTDREHLAIQGRSNGGLLIGAVITQKPDVCAVAFPVVGVLDMLRYHKFTIGWAWATDYGTSETKEGFEYLIKYSPIHNAKSASYPATLITTADHDDRVVPAHSFKFAATMQAAAQGANPMLIRIDVSAGHGAGKPTSKQIDEVTDILGFMFFQMGITPNAK